MKPTELRLGNYVYGINRRSEIHLPNDLPLRIVQIEIFNSYALPLNKSPAEEKYWFKISNSDLSPIPLTKQWLKDLEIKKLNIIGDVIIGATYWKKDDIIFYEIKDNFYITIGEKMSAYRGRRLIQFNKVHELQNIFASAGKELIKK